MHSGGTLSEFKVGDDLPLDVEYYDYPSDFYIVLDDYDEPLAAVVRNGKFDGFILDPNDTSEFKTFYDKHGRPIKINDPNGLKRYLRALRDEYTKEVGHRDFLRFDDEWYGSESLGVRLAELFECWNSLRGFDARYDSVGEDVLFKSIKENLNELRGLINEFKNDHERVFNDYLTSHGIEW